MTYRMFSSIRVRLTLWYLLIFGSLLIIFSTYIYSFVSRDMHSRFDASILRTAQSMASYFIEFKNQNDAEEAAQTIRVLKEGRESAALYREGQLIAADDDSILEAISSTKILDKPATDKKFAIATEPDLNKRLVILQFESDNVKYAVAVLEPLDKLDGEIGYVRNIILFGLPAALLLATLGGFLLVRKSLLAMVSISEQAKHISAKNLNDRLVINNPDDELGRLAVVFNDLLSRLDTSFQVMREFMADASHELRTPLTIVHGEAQVALSQTRATEEYQQSLSIIRSQSKRMALIVSDMLALARADAGESQHLRKEELYLNDLIEECCDSALILAELKKITFNYETGDEDILFWGNEELLKRMVVNLIDNAIHYTNEGGIVSAKLEQKAEAATLTISDTGIGIPKDRLERIFDRFYRVEDPGVPATSGSGLGLSIVKLATDSHRGSIKVESVLGQGSTFQISLPLDQPESEN